MSIDQLKKVVRARIGERGGIVHSVGTLVGGTAFAQGLTILALPLLTRLYTPAEFSVLAVYASLLGILSVVACLRLEIAIPLPERDEDAAGLLALALTCGLGFSLLVGVAILLAHEHVAVWLRIPAFTPYLWLVPVGMWTASAYAAMQFWATRKKRFPRIARTRMAQALGGVGFQVGAGAVGIGPFGLLFGHLINNGAGFVGLARDAWRYDGASLRSVTRKTMRRMLASYSRFPTYSTLEALANTAGMQLPIIIIAALAAGPEAGFLLLATRIMAAPMSLVGTSMAQVYLAHAPEEMRAGRLGAFTARIFSGLLKTGVGPLLFAGIVAGPLATVVFGKEWSRVGELVAWMTPWFVLQFLSSPVSMVMYVMQRQGLMVTMQMVGLAVRIGAIWFAMMIAPDCLAESYAVSGALLYAFFCLVYYRIAGIGVRDVFRTIRQTFVLLFCWTAAGIGVRLLALAQIKFMMWSV